MRGHTLPSSKDIPESVVREEVACMIKQRQSRTTATSSSRKRKASPAEELLDDPRARAPPPPEDPYAQENRCCGICCDGASFRKTRNWRNEEPKPAATDGPLRDSNVSDETWNKLQSDKEEAKRHREGLGSLRKTAALLKLEIRSMIQ
ncbi:P-loop containing nucleoside triphosphate hydrolase protein [Penicillium sp. IBT 16267x]|nr:P-loop containing nucleoside triphosphate hydrolase protein [Penicillium sp. IBT 16267x]